MSLRLTSTKIAGIEDLVRYHLKVEPIVYKYIDKSEATGKPIEIYMVKSIKQKNQSYNIVNEDNEWVCDCPSFKYKSGVDSSGHCKHIRFIIFLLAEHVEITVI